MMKTITVRRSDERGKADHGWLKAAHTFSFAGYMDPEHMGYRSLRVINEDRVLPARGFGRHPHQNMEIITYVLEGELAHEDSAGHRAVMTPGMVQVMSAGTGIYHSEMNPSKTESVHLLQIWILPEKDGTEPGYADKDFSAALDTGGPVLVASPDGAGESHRIGQDARLYAARPAAGAEHRYQPKHGYTWIQVARGVVEVEGETLTAGDAAAIEGSGEIRVKATEPAEYLLFDLA